MIFSDQIKICNLIGAGSSLILICIYLLYEIKHYTLDAILNALIILTGSVSVYRGFTLVIDDNSIIGKICVVTALIVFLSPLQIIYKVIKEKTYFLIPVYTAIVSLFSTGCLMRSCAAGIWGKRTTALSKDHATRCSVSRRPLTSKSRILRR